MFLVNENGAIKSIDCKVNGCCINDGTSLNVEMYNALQVARQESEHS